MIRDTAIAASFAESRDRQIVLAARNLLLPARVVALSGLSQHEDVQLLCPGGVRQADKLAANLRRRLKRLQPHEVRVARSALGYMVVVGAQDQAQAAEVRAEATAWRNSPENNDSVNRPNTVVDGTKAGRAPPLYPRLYGREARAEIEARDQAQLHKKPQKRRGRLRLTDEETQ